MKINRLIQSLFETNCYIVSCDTTNEAVIIDPGSDGEKIITFIADNNLNVKHILLTHGHFDHCASLSAIIEKIEAPISIHSDDLPLMVESKTQAFLYGIKIPDVPSPTNFIQEGDIFEFGENKLKAIHTPGHSPGGCCFFTDKILFSGDTLFSNSIGRTDLPGGNHQQILSSIKNNLYILDDDTIVYPGHGEETTIAEEKQFNPHTQ